MAGCLTLPVDPPQVLATDGLRAEVRRYACPDREVIVLFSGPFAVADFTSPAAMARAGVDLTTLALS